MKVLGFVGWSGSGKTTLMESCIPYLVGAGLKVSVVKHAHCGFDIDRPGKDSYRHREAGANEVLLASDRRWVLMHELRSDVEPLLEQLVSRLSPCDLVLVEGFKSSNIPMFEVYRPSLGQPPLYEHNPNIVAVVSDDSLEAKVPVLGLKDPAGVAAHICECLGFSKLLAARPTPPERSRSSKRESA